MEQKQEIRKLNTLRGLAAFIVLITHFSDATGWLDGVLGGRAGQYGVMLFFLLSGFLMAHLYLDRPFERGLIKRYAMARLGRVLPLFLLVVLTSFIAPYVGVSGFYDLSGWSYFIAHLLFLEGESVLWSVAPEVHFYWLLVFGFMATWLFVFGHCRFYGTFVFNELSSPSWRLFRYTI